MLYRKIAVDRHGPGSREVMDWQSGIVFFCPCDERRVYITSPTHTITFDSDGVLTLDPSCGYRESEYGQRHPQNWCHFWLKDGEATMVSDSKCPGSEL